MLSLFACLIGSVSSSVPLAEIFECSLDIGPIQAEHVGDHAGLHVGNADPVIAERDELLPEGDRVGAVPARIRKILLYVEAPGTADHSDKGGVVLCCFIEFEPERSAELARVSHGDNHTLLRH